MLAWKAPIHTSHEEQCMTTNTNARVLNPADPHLYHSSNHPSLLQDPGKQTIAGDSVINVCVPIQHPESVTACRHLSLACREEARCPTTEEVRDLGVTGEEEQRTGKAEGAGAWGLYRRTEETGKAATSPDLMGEGCGILMCLWDPPRVGKNFFNAFQLEKIGSCRFSTSLPFSSLFLILLPEKYLFQVRIHISSSDLHFLDTNVWQTSSPIAKCSK